MKQKSFSDNPDPQLLNKRQWLKSTLQHIQNNVAWEASSILQNNIRRKQNNNNNNKNKSAQNRQLNLQELNEQEAKIRKKLTQINQMKKTIRTRQAKTYDNYKNVIKNNQQLKKLTKKYREFKQNLEEKARVIEEKQQRDKLKIIKLKEQHLKTLCEQRKKKIQKAMQKINLRKLKREQQLKLERAKLKQLKNQRLYEKMLRSYNKRINDSNESKLNEYDRFKKSRIVNFSSLSEHQKNYEQLRSQKQQKRTVKLAESRLLPEINIYKSKFTKRVQEEQKKAKQLIKFRLQYGKLVRQRHKQFQERVKEDFAPTPKQTDSINEKQNRISALDYQQIKKKGNQYYRMGQKFAIPIQKRSQYQKKRILEQSLTNKQKVYPDYLTEVLKKVTCNKKQGNSYHSQLEQIKKTMRDNKIKKEDKLQEVRVLIQSMSYSFQPNKQFSEQQLIKRLKIKLQLLQMLQTNK